MSHLPPILAIPISRIFRLVISNNGISTPNRPTRSHSNSILRRFMILAQCIVIREVESRTPSIPRSRLPRGQDIPSHLPVIQPPVQGTLSWALLNRVCRRTGQDHNRRILQRLEDRIELLLRLRTPPKASSSSPSSRHRSRRLQGLAKTKII